MALLERAFERERLLYRTRQTYRGCVARFLREANWSLGSYEDVVSDYLSAHAPDWAAATQNQALNAIIFLFRHAVDCPLGKLPEWTYAKKPKRLPVWLSHEEAMRTFMFMREPNRLACEVMYGSGLRISEVARLRLKDIDYANLQIIIRDGKGEKDRRTLLPVSLVEKVREQAEYATAVWNQDRRDGVGPVQLPESVQRKYPRRGYELGEFWLIPSGGLARNPKWGNTRFHLHVDTLAKAIPVAARKAGILKHVKAHVYRHTFATEFLLNGGNIRQLQELLGHTHLETTEIYAHCLPLCASAATSPLDRQPANIVPMHPDIPAPARRFA